MTTQFPCWTVMTSVQMGIKQANTARYDLHVYGNKSTLHNCKVLVTRSLLLSVSHHVCQHFSANLSAHSNKSPMSLSSDFSSPPTTGSFSHSEPTKHADTTKQCAALLSPPCIYKDFLFVSHGPEHWFLIGDLGLGLFYTNWNHIVIELKLR